MEAWMQKVADYQKGKPPLADRLQERVTQRDRETILWKKWKDSKETDQQVLSELFQSLAPLIARISMNYQGNLPPAYINGLVKQHTLKALQTWDPEKSQLNTHITNSCQKVLREIYKYQSPTRSSEESHLRVPTYQNLRANMESRLERPPTALEMSREMGIGIGEVSRLQAGSRRNLAEIEGELKWKPSEQQKTEEILLLVEYELSPQEAQVLEMTFGLHNKPKLSSKQIAQKMDISAARVSQLKKRISEVVQRHYVGKNTPDMGE